MGEGWKAVTHNGEATASRAGDIVNPLGGGEDSEPFKITGQLQTQGKGFGKEGISDLLMKCVDFFFSFCISFLRIS